jgi:hypothetical protein
MTHKIGEKLTGYGVVPGSVEGEDSDYLRCTVKMVACLWLNKRGGYNGKAPNGEPFTG